MKFRKSLLLPALILSTMLASVSHGSACSRWNPFRLNELFIADFIIRATAVKYIVPAVPNTRTTGVPESTIEFKVEETIWGDEVPSTIVLHGYLTDTDDFNEVPLPYKFVRPGGRAGSCFANSYKQGAQFLLFVKRGGQNASTSGYTTNISALGPTNEQIRGAQDPWVKWVKAYLSPCPGQNVKDSDFGIMSKPEMESVAGKQSTNLDKYRFAKCYVSRFGLNDETAKNHARVIDYYETNTARPDGLPAPR